VLLIIADKLLHKMKVNLDRLERSRMKYNPHDPYLTAYMEAIYEVEHEPAADSDELARAAMEDEDCMRIIHERMRV